MRDTKQSGVLRGLRGTGLGRAHKVTTPGTVRTTRGATLVSDSTRDHENSTVVGDTHLQEPPLYPEIADLEPQESKARSTDRSKKQSFSHESVPCPRIVEDMSSKEPSRGKNRVSSTGKWAIAGTLEGEPLPEKTAEREPETVLALWECDQQPQQQYSQGRKYETGRMSHPAGKQPSGPFPVPPYVSDSEPKIYQSKMNTPTFPVQSNHMSKPEKFSGKRQDWVRYRQQFEFYVKSIGIPEESIPTIILTYLQPADFSKVANLEMSKEDLKDVKGAFLKMDKVLGTPVSKMGALLALSSIVQGAESSITDFAERIREQLSTSGQPAGTSGNELALRQLIRGIDSDEIAISIVQEEISQFETAVDFAIKWELAKSARASFSTRKRADGEGLAVSAVSEVQQELSESEIMILMKRIDELEDAMEERLEDRMEEF